MRYVVLTVSLLFSTQLMAGAWQESEKIAEIFEAAEVNGTFVLYDVKADQFTGYNSMRANQRFIPASTFKIPNSLIGLSSGAIKNVDEVLPYGGQPQLFKSWEQDMNLREAIVASNVPVYKELARRIGLEEMRRHVVSMEYGSGEIGTVVDEFWLTGPLKISAVEQVQFLTRLTEETLPFSKADQRIVREISRLEATEGVVLYGKTGWENASKQGVGWWVGWMEKGEEIYVFALNMDMQDASDAPLRLELGKASLKALGIL